MLVQLQLLRTDNENGTSVITISLHPLSPRSHPPRNLVTARVMWSVTRAQQPSPNKTNNASTLAVSMFILLQ